MQQNQKNNPLRLANGLTLRDGQLIVDNIARNGAPKRTHVPAVAWGMRDRGATDHPLPFVGGRRPLDDEPNDKAFLNGKSSPIHNGMGSETPEHRGADWGVDHGSTILGQSIRGLAKHGEARLPQKK